MDDVDFDSAVKAVTYSEHGTPTFRTEYAGPFINTVHAELRGIGFEEGSAAYLEENFSLPKAWPRSGYELPKAVFGVDDIAIGVAIYVSMRLGDWAIGKVADGVFGTCVQPLWRILRTKKDDKAPPPARQSFEFTIWFDGSRTALSVGTDVGTADGNVQKAIGEAIANATEWASKNDATDKQLRYSVEDGKLNLVPEIVDLAASPAAASQPPKTYATPPAPVPPTDAPNANTAT